MKNKMIFVFGSNTAGVHGAGAALYAYQNYGARYNKGYGHYGDSFAIPTKDNKIKTLPLERIQGYVTGFIEYAKGQPELKFQVTQIGCGLAGYTPEQIAPMFMDAPANCFFDVEWMPILGNQANYWGTLK